MAMQKEFAQMGIRWRTEDAVAAGIHPLAALGASGASYSPSPAHHLPDYSKSDLYHNMGQSLSRAVSAGQTREERLAAQLRLKNMDLQNKLLESQITSITRPTNPALPSDWGLNIPGQGNSTNTLVEPVPMRRTHSIPGAPYADVGHIADFAFIRTPHGLAIAPSKDVKERIEDQIIPETMWALRNQLLPNLPGKSFPKPTTKEYPLPEDFRKMGYRSWKWSYLLQQFIPSKKEK